MIIIRSVVHGIHVSLVFTVVFTSKCGVQDLSIAVASPCSQQGSR